MRAVDPPKGARPATGERLPYKSIVGQAFLPAAEPRCDAGSGPINFVPIGSIRRTSVPDYANRRFVNEGARGGKPSAVVDLLTADDANG